MKWYELYSSFVLFILAFSKLCALYNGNPAQPQLEEKGVFLPQDSFLGIKGGYQGDFVFNKSMEVNKKNLRKVDKFKYSLNQATFTVNIVEKVEFYCSAGAMQAHLVQRPVLDGQKREYQTDSQFSWGAGVRALFVNWGKAFLGLDGKYQRSQPALKWNSLQGSKLPTNATFKYEEFQAGLACAYQIKYFFPYVAILYSSVKSSLHSLGSNMQLGVRSFKMTEGKYGLALGLSATTGKYFDAGIEARFFSENALSLAANLKF